MLLDPSETFAGHRVQAFLGHGGSSEVYRAVAPDGRPVALKVVHPSVAATRVGQERFERECALAATLQHPNVVRVCAHGRARRVGSIREPLLLWLTAELMTGGSAAGLAPVPPAGLATALDVLRQAADGLDYVHTHDVVHGDVKPSNLLLTGDRPRAAVADFGIARVLDEARALARNGRVQGSLPYAAPEVLTARRVGPQTDVYGLTCTLVELLTGRPPYPRSTDFAVVYAHLNEAPPSLPRRVGWLPTRLDAVVRRGLDVDPAQRWPSCGALVAAAETALADVDAGLEPTGPAPRRGLLARLRRHAPRLRPRARPGR